MDSRAFAPVSPAEIEARRAIVQNLGLKSGDAAFPANCAGTLVPTDPSRSHAGCPSTSRLVAALGLPRVGDATERSNSNARFRTVRVIVADIGREGISAEIRDYVLDGSGAQWKVVRMKLLGYWE